jgi:adenylate cyclase, class 2
VRPDRFERPTNWFEASCSIQLSYGRTCAILSFTAVATEIEIKLRWTQAASAAVERITGLGWKAMGPRTLEVDQVYDRGGELKSTDRLLRVRREIAEGQDRAEPTPATITFKGPAERSRYKRREEIEVVVDDAANFELVLERLGYLRAFRYEKFRTKFQREPQGMVTLDETPIGVFLELEGQQDWIDRVAEELGFSREDYLTASYASLFREQQKQNQSTRPDMTFEL